MFKYGKYTCINMGVYDTSNGKTYTEDMIKQDPKLKEYIEQKMTENIQKTLNMCGRG